MSSTTHDELRALAEENGTTIADMLRRLIRHERQRRMAIENAERLLTPEDHAVVRSSAATVRRASRRRARG